jgi:hypothetical protein
MIHRLEKIEDFRSSTKIEALMEELELLVQVPYLHFCTSKVSKFVLLLVPQQHQNRGPHASAGTNLLALQYKSTLLLFYYCFTGMG